MHPFDAGYEIVADVLSPTECDAILAALSPATAGRSRAGIRHLMSHPVVNEVATSKKMIEIARSWAGTNAVPFRATLFEKSGQANWLVPWHQDTALPLVAKFDAPGWGPWSEKAGTIYAHAPTEALERVIALRLHLDASTEENGPLRVITGSHARGLLTDAEVVERSATAASTECLVPRGGVIAMRPLLIHASSKCQRDAPRRVLHIEYADSLDFGDGVRIAVT